MKRFSIYEFYGRTSYTFFLMLKTIQTLFLETLSITDKNCDKQLSDLQGLRYKTKQANMTYDLY